MSHRGNSTLGGWIFILGMLGAALAAVFTVQMGAELHSSKTEEVWILDVEYNYDNNFTILYMTCPPRPFLKAQGIHNVTEFPAKYLVSWTNIKSKHGEYNRLEVLILIDS